MAVTVKIPDKRTFVFENLVLDYNGTLAVDGILKKEVNPLIKELSKKLKIFVLTADTFGNVSEQMKDMPVSVTILQKGKQDEAKMKFVEKLGFNNTVAIGNGTNDRLMLEKAALGIAVILDEGVAVKTLQAADMFCKNIEDALMLLLKPKRLIAGLR
jgi:soluble P-type ATPase